jgi:hypothetical protein
MELNFRMPLSRLNAGIASSDKIDGYFEGFLGIVSYNKIGRNTKPSRHRCRHSLNQASEIGRENLAHWYIWQHCRRFDYEGDR